MKHWTLIAILSCWASFARAEDMHEYLSQTETLARQGKHAEALERFIWFHENVLQHDESMSGVRLSFALIYWDKLAEKYPPARNAMLEIRDRTTRRLLESGGNFTLFQEAAALNRTLKDDAGTIHLFEELEKAYPKEASTYWIVAKDYVIAAKRYDIASRYIKDLEQEFRRIRQRYEEDLELADDPRLGPDFKTYTQNHLTESVLQLIEVALATDRRKEAESIQQQALAVRDDMRIREAIPAPPKADE